MGALQTLPREAAESCTALAFSTNWPAEEWAIATKRLLDNAMPMEEMGMARLIQLTLATQAPPSDIAERMVLEYKAALASAAGSS